MRTRIAHPVGWPQEMTGKLHRSPTRFFVAMRPAPIHAVICPCPVHVEIAERLRMPLNAAKSRIRNGLRSLLVEPAGELGLPSVTTLEGATAPDIRSNRG